MSSEPPPSANDLRVVGPSLQSLAKVLDVGILFVDLRGTVEFASPSARELLGVPDEAKVNEVWKVLKNELRASGHGRKDGDLTTEGSVVVTLSAAAGTRRRLRVRVRKLSADECIGHLVTLRDLALIEALERDVRLAGRYRNLTRIHAAAAHDLKGALNAISLTLQVQKRLLERIQTSDGDAIKSCLQYTATLIDEAQRLGNLTQDLLVHSIETPEAIQEFDLRLCAEEFAALVTPLCVEHDIEFHVTTPSTPVLVSGRRERFKQALMNLAINAVDALAGRPGRIEVEVRAVQDHGVFLVTDTGPGIPDHLMERIWDLHFTTKRGGSGIGLHVVRMVVNDHGGTVHASNRPKGGCAFEIKIPLVRKKP